MRIWYNTTKLYALWSLCAGEGREESHEGTPLLFELTDYIYVSNIWRPRIWWHLELKSDINTQILTAMLNLVPLQNTEVCSLTSFGAGTYGGSLISCSKCHPLDKQAVETNWQWLARRWIYNSLGINVTRSNIRKEGRTNVTLFSLCWAGVIIGKLMYWIVPCSLDSTPLTLLYAPPSAFTAQST